MVQIVEGVDVRSFNLSAEEGYLLSRIDGHSSCEDLIHLTGLQQTLVVTTLKKLIDFGVVSDAQKRPASPPSAAAKGAETSVLKQDDGSAQGGIAPAKGSADSQYGDFVFSDADLRDDVDISPDQQKNILFYEAKIEQWNHFELLNLGPAAGAGEVRKAYFLASKKFHPDAYFRKELGPFTKKIEKIFKAMKVAYDVLSNDKTRDAYVKTAQWTKPQDPKREAPMSPSASSVQTGSAPQAEIDPAVQLRAALLAAEESAKRAERERLRKKVVKERRLRRNPMVRRLQKASELHQLGVEAMAAERWQEAANHLALAITYDPQKKVYHRSYSEAAGMANYMRAQNLVRTMEGLVDTEDDEAIVPMLEELRHIAEDNAEIMAQAAQVLLKAGAVRRAFEAAQLAVSRQENYLPGLRVLADASERAEKWHSAVRALSHLCELKPDDKSYVSRLRVARKKI